jgi:hypothetical protein
MADSYQKNEAATEEPIPGPSSETLASGNPTETLPKSRPWDVYSFWTTEPVRVSPAKPRKGGKGKSSTVEVLVDLEELPEEEESEPDWAPVVRRSLARANLWQLSGPETEMSNLPVKSTRVNALLIKTCKPEKHTIR